MTDPLIAGPDQSDQTKNVIKRATRKSLDRAMLPTHFIIDIVKFLPLFSLFTEIVSEMKPKVLVFDLDYTLWPFWVDTHVDPPFRKTADGSVLDARGRKITHYPEVPEVLNDLHKQGYVLAVASRTGEIEGATQLMKLFEWDKFFSHEEIYPGGKVRHITNIKDRFGVQFSDMIFFDDEGRNIRDVSELGVLSILVRNGVNKKIVEDALKQYQQKSDL